MKSNMHQMCEAKMAPEAECQAYYETGGMVFMAIVIGGLLLVGFAMSRCR